MLAIKAIFGFVHQPTPHQLLQQYLNLISINTPQPLPPLYYQFPQINSKNTEINLVFQQLVRALQSVNSIGGVFKILTVILKNLRISGYQIEYLQFLSQIQIPEILKAQRSDNQWAYQIVVAIKSYLLRLPSIAQILQTSIHPTFQIPTNSDTCLANLFSLINVFGLLFPHLNNGINTVGRYYMKTHYFMEEFYSVLKDEVLLGYKYIEKIVKKFIIDYKECSLRSLEFFLSIIPEIELYCDKAEEFLMNKYFRGKGPTTKIYLKQDIIQEISYFLSENVSAMEEKTNNEN